MRITDQNNTGFDNYDLLILKEVLIQWEYLEQNMSRNPQDANDGVNERYKNKRIEYKTLNDGIKPFTSKKFSTDEKIPKYAHSAIIVVILTVEK